MGLSLIGECSKKCTALWYDDDEGSFLIGYLLVFLFVIVCPFRSLRLSLLISAPKKADWAKPCWIAPATLICP